MGATIRTLKGLPYWEDLTDSQQEMIGFHAVTREYKKGQLIHSGDKECLGMIQVLSGSVRTYILSEEGREITLFRLNKGECCVLSAACLMEAITFETQMAAAEDVELLIVPSRIFERLKEKNIYVRCFMYEMMMERFSATMWTMQEILFKGFDRRLASFLVKESERTGKTELRMTHEQIAEHTNSAREVVARMLKRFENEGLVEHKRGAVRIKDLEALKLME